MRQKVTSIQSDSSGFQLTLDNVHKVERTRLVIAGALNRSLAAGTVRSVYSSVRNTFLGSAGREPVQRKASGSDRGRSECSGISCADL